MSQEEIASYQENTFYAILIKVVRFLKNRPLPFSALEIHQLINAPYFPITIERVEEVLEELHNNSILGRWEFENGDVKYE